MTRTLISRLMAFLLLTILCSSAYAATDSDCPFGRTDDPRSSALCMIWEPTPPSIRALLESAAGAQLNPTERSGSFTPLHSTPSSSLSAQTAVTRG